MNPTCFPFQAFGKMRVCKHKEPRMQRVSTASREQFWREAVTRQRESGLSIKGFCAKEALAIATFFVWKPTLAGGAAPASVGFAPVRLQPETLSEPVPGGIEILLAHGRRIRLTGAVDRRQLRDVLAALVE
jgi:hypothetical protein